MDGGSRIPPDSKWCLGQSGSTPEKEERGLYHAFPQRLHKLFCQGSAAAKGCGNDWPPESRSEKITNKHVYQKTVMTFFIASIGLDS